MAFIISIEEAKTLGRPIGKVADNKIAAFIMEVEQTIIRKALGDNLYLKLIDDESLDDTLKTLVDGGLYTDKCGNKKMIKGLKTAEAYYVYAQNVRAGDFESTRYGMVHKDGDYSSPISTKERDQAANSATAVADYYLREVQEYCDQMGIDRGNGANNLHITSGCIIRKIG